MYIALKQSYMTYQTNETIHTHWLEKKPNTLSKCNNLCNTNQFKMCLTLYIYIYQYVKSSSPYLIPRVSNQRHSKTCTRDQSVTW